MSNPIMKVGNQVQYKGRVWEIADILNGLLALWSLDHTVELEGWYDPKLVVLANDNEAWAEWKNLHAEQERKQEEAAFMNDPDLEISK